ncbi:MAG: CBS domain-containing protein [Betaproteobacteria bacterium]|nr:CBS domain-containing protein [Betaproteobacteria bacterium]
MPNRCIRDVIQGRPLFTTLADATVREACRRMTEARVGAVLVVGQDGLLKGIFTERDALNRVLARSLDPDTTPLAQVMTPDPRSVDAERPLGYALHLMHIGGYRHMPVTEAGRPIGMVSVRDALGAEIISFERELEEFEQIAVAL